MSNGILSRNIRKMNHCGTSCSTIKCWKWDITPVILMHNKPSLRYAVLILNRPISQEEAFMKNFWEKATLRITVDGGALRWDQFLTRLPEEISNKMKIPDLITGDFDSITEETLQKYKKKGCKVVHTPDQDYTDFTKALKELNNHCQEHTIEVDNVIAIGQASGRLDQILGNIQTLYLAEKQHLLHPETKLYLMSGDSLSWLLEPGNHIISIPEETRKHNRAWCSLVPIGETCHSVTTSGLMWNLDNQSLKFGELVSTSNAFDGSDTVKIKCSHTILWSMKVPSLTGE
ncbi:thiamin pyrophosphokinase 1 isoform X2 [Bombyx mori]|uniref:Thiamine pyrophosphokinase n=1 Tax=Bombyx mori TaxID=7091 RepID=A0A8R2R077_BOMMO|nr:thiamin pyrophosphokinase 1 isoform X2 [Bombyx mori]